MTKGEIRVALYEATKWAKENNAEAFEDIKAKFQLAGINACENIMYLTKKAMRLNRAEMMDLMCKVVECIY